MHANYGEAMHAMAIGLIILSVIGLILAILIIKFLIKKEYKKVIYTLIPIFFAGVYYLDYYNFYSNVYSIITFIGFLVLHIKLKTKITLSLIILKSSIEISNLYLRYLYDTGSINTIAINISYFLNFLFAVSFLIFALNISNYIKKPVEENNQLE